MTARLRIGARLLAVGLVVLLVTLRPDMSLWAHLPLRQAEQQALADCGVLDTMGVVRVVEQDLDAPCGDSWLVRQADGASPGAWLDWLVGRAASLDSPLRVRLRAGRVALRAGLELPLSFGPTLRALPEDPAVDDLLEDAGERTAAWLDPVLADRRASIRWWRLHDTPPDAAALLRRQAWGWVPPAPEALEAAWRDAAPGGTFRLRPQGPRLGQAHLQAADLDLERQIQAACPTRPKDCRLLLADLLERPSANDEAAIEAQADTEARAPDAPRTAALLTALLDDEREREAAGRWLGVWAAWIRRAPSRSAAWSQVFGQAHGVWEATGPRGLLALSRGHGTGLDVAAMIVLLAEHDPGAWELQLAEGAVVLDVRDGVLAWTGEGGRLAEIPTRRCPAEPAALLAALVGQEEGERVEKWRASLPAAARLVCP